FIEKRRQTKPMHSFAFFAFDPKQLLEIVYVVTGLTLLVFAIMSFLDDKNPRRFGTGIFWLILAIIFVMGTVLPHWVTGLMVLAMAGIDGAGRIAKGDYNEPSKSTLLEHAQRLGDKIFLPVLLIPIITILAAGTFRLLNQFLNFSLDTNQGALVGLVVGSL